MSLLFIIFDEHFVLYSLVITWSSNDFRLEKCIFFVLI